MFFIEREMRGRRYRLAVESIWDSATQRSVPRQVILGPADPSCIVDLADTEHVGDMRLGDTGALAWVVEQLDVVGMIDRICHETSCAGDVSLGEMVVAVAMQRACAPGPKCGLADFLGSSLPRACCLPAKLFTGQAFHRLASRVEADQLDKVQVELAKAIVQRFGLSTSVLAYDTTNFDTYIDTTTPGELARRGHAKSKRNDLRVVGLGVLASETGHVPLLFRAYPGNASDQAVLGECLDGLGRLHDALDEGEGRKRSAHRTVVRDGGFWSEQLELELEFVGYHSIISLPMSHKAAQGALESAARPGAMTSLKGDYKDVRAARSRANIGELERTLVVVESKNLLEGQKRGIASALLKARKELRALQKRASQGRISREALELRVKKALGREHLSFFVVTDIGGTDKAPTFRWRVDAKLRRKLETTRLGRRVLCTDRHSWGTERIVHGFRGQWNVEEIFRRQKGGGLVPWGPSYQHADASLRLHTFACVLGVTLVSLVKLQLGAQCSIKSMMQQLADMKVTLVKGRTGKPGRPPTAMIRPRLSPFQAAAAEVFELGRWMPSILSSIHRRQREAVPAGTS